MDSTGKTTVNLTGKYEFYVVIVSEGLWITCMMHWWEHQGAAVIIINKTVELLVVVLIESTNSVFSRR